MMKFSIDYPFHMRGWKVTVKGHPEKGQKINISTQTSAYPQPKSPCQAEPQ